MGRMIPFILAAVAIVVLTVVEGTISERWIDLSREASYGVELLKQVPKDIGDWNGKDSEEVDEQVLRVAGAKGFVSRDYKNEKTGQFVSVWMIVGHARDTAEHTPDVCYPASGYQTYEERNQYEIDVEGMPVQCWTGMFQRRLAVGESNVRVFWTWFRPDEEGNIEWIAPKNPRFHFGSTPALYKLYFSTGASDADEDPSQSVCLEFAPLFLSEIKPLLEKANQGAPEDFVVPEQS